MKSKSVVPVVDVFAGPGGLGEGFSSVRGRDGDRVFKIGLSVEMDEFAYRTLLLRCFFRQFDEGEAPSAYYQYLRGEPPWEGATVFDLLRKFPVKGDAASSEAWREELRPAVADQIDARIRSTLGPRRTRGPWVLVGGPPCQAYSVAGRARMLGERGDRFYADKRHTLYREYLRLLAEHAPTVFVMENVKGLLSSTSRNGDKIFERILSDLRNPPDSSLRYRLFAVSKGEAAQEPLFSPAEAEDPSQFVVESERHGIPQARHRVIIVGALESDLSSELCQPRLLTERAVTPTCLDAIGDLPKLRSGLSREADSVDRWLAVLRNATKANWFRCLRRNGHSDVFDVIQTVVASLRVPVGNRGNRFMICNTGPAFRAGWLRDPQLGGICNHESRQHRSDDLHRYLFVSSYGRARHTSPRLRDFPPDLLPEHENVVDALQYRLFVDRFRVQLGREPATTITSHISKDGHYFIHPDPAQCRSLTVREAARIQTFPDNYFFEGPRTEAYRQVGNAVPPLLAHQIAKIVAGMLRLDARSSPDG